MLFADDIVLVDESEAGLASKLELWRGTLEGKGFRLSRTKTEYVKFNFWISGVQDSELQLGEISIPRKECFKYLGSVLQSNGRINKDVDHRVQVAWLK